MTWTVLTVVNRPPFLFYSLLVGNFLAENRRKPAIVGYLALFGSVGLIFVFANLLLGRFLRPDDPHEEKQEIYECGEPAIGSSFVQFDLRFYVVALIFIIFDVEVAFLFPWATIFGKANELVDTKAPIVTVADSGEPALTTHGANALTEMGGSIRAHSDGPGQGASFVMTLPYETDMD